MSYDVLVVGGGIVGASLAYHAVLAGARTCLVDARDAGRATDAGAGIVSPGTNTRDPDAWQQLARAAVEEYPRLDAALRERQAADPGYARVGMLVVAVDEDEAKRFDRYASALRARSEPGDGLREVDGSEARDLFPALGGVERALYHPLAARVDGRLFEAALLGAAVQAGLDRRAARVERLLLADGRVSGVEIDGTDHRAAGVAICGGAWSARFEAQLGVRLPVVPQRGQILHLGLPGRDTSRWAMIVGLRDHYIVPWPDSRVAVGATRETGSGFDPRPTAAGVREVLDEALRVAPGLADATLREIRVGLRPCTPDLLPLLGPLPGIENLYVATGHGPTGLTLGPLSGKLVAALMRGDTPEIDLAPFSPDRDV